MDLKELRYGVSQLIDNRFGVVITIDDRYICSFHENPEQFKKDFSPIPITEEWLFKLGFENCEINIDDLELSILVKTKCLIITSNDEPYGISVDIDFIHQLQNIIYDLTKKELTIK